MAGGFGVVLKIKVSNVLTAIARVVDVEWPEFEKILAENTSHNISENGGYATYRATGKRKMNSFPVTLEWDRNETTHDAIIAAFDSDDPVDMSIEDPEGVEVIAFSAHVFKVGRVTPQEDYYQANVEIQPSGAPTVDTGESV